MAFVLSGGGNLGALQVGMLRALLEHGVMPDLVLGCSVGAINGAGFADDPTLDGIANLERVWTALDGQDVLPTGWLPTVSLARRGEAIHDHGRLRQMAEESLRAATFADLAVRFECVATDVAGAREVWFSSGPLIEPILASSAIPAIYPAVEIDGVRYLDGGIVDDVPMTRAVELGARTVYVLQVGSFLRPRREPRRPLDVAVQAYWVARHHRFKRELAALPPDVDVHVLPTGETPRVRFNDFTHSRTLMTRAYEASRAYLAGDGPSALAAADEPAAAEPAEPPSTEKRASRRRRKSAPGRDTAATGRDGAVVPARRSATGRDGTRRRRLAGAARARPGTARRAPTPAADAVSAPSGSAGAPTVADGRPAGDAAAAAESAVADGRRSAGDAGAAAGAAAASAVPDGRRPAGDARATAASAAADGRRSPAGVVVAARLPGDAGAATVAGEPAGDGTPAGESDTAGRRGRSATLGGRVNSAVLKRGGALVRSRVAVRGRRPAD